MVGLCLDALWEVNLTDMSLSYSESNINSTDDNVKQEVSNLKCWPDIHEMRKPDSSEIIKRQDLDSIMKVGKMGIRFSNQRSICIWSNTLFVRASWNQDKNQDNGVSPKVNVIKQQVFKKNTKRWICHFCCRLGHIHLIYFC